MSSPQRPVSNHGVQVTLKLATSLDGKIALANGESEWVTGDGARREGRRLRGLHDAIAVGSNTAVLDNPQLTTRVPGLPDPVRVVFDTRLRLSPDSNLARTADEVPVVVLTAMGVDADRVERLRELDVSVVEVPQEKGHVSLDRALAALARSGIRSLLVEGGGHLAASFLRAGLVEALEWFTAPILIGGDGRSCVAALELSRMSEVLAFERTELREIGPDLHETFRVAI